MSPKAREKPGVKLKWGCNGDGFLLVVIDAGLSRGFGNIDDTETHLNI